MPTTTATPSATDRIEKQVTIDTSRSRVWRAITDVSQFNTWFGVSLGSLFVAGAEVRGNFTNPKFADVTLTLWIESVEPERFFSFRWHPYPMEKGADLEAEPTTLVTFTLEEIGGATRLTIVESGFDALPEARRATCFSMNSKGWEGQSQKLKKFVET
jgi:uncharacterized protein YndB with AHSA1/START domain